MAQQDAERTYYQQSMEAQAKQRSELQAQLMIEQLQQLLVKELESDKWATGKCVLVETDGGVSNRLKCDNGTLFEVISNKQKDVAGMLIALRGTGRTFNGFTAEMNDKKRTIKLSDDHSATGGNNPAVSK